VIYPSLGDDPIVGSANSTVTVVEFGCYLCPYTAQAQPIVKEVLAKYGDRIRFVFKDFPLPHPESRLVSVAAGCSLEQGKFWEFHDMLFDFQKSCKMSVDRKELEEFLRKTAEGAGLDAKLFDDCLVSGRRDGEINSDIEEGMKAHITGTPTFFINNHTIVGPKPFAAFAAIIEQELK
jgi:protein-disulfide isomerase